MSATAACPTVDADGHVLEPRDVWQKYLEPNLRERAIRIEDDDEGFEVLMVDDAPHLSLRGRLGALGGIEMSSKELMTPGMRSYEDGCVPGGYDPAARLSVMDDEGIDMALLYPTLGIAWEGLVRDPQLATAYSRAYNRWIVDFCSHDRRRLVPIAHICLKDPEGAVQEVLRAREAGCAGVYLSPDPEARGGMQLDDPQLARFWETVQDLEMPIGFHVVARSGGLLRPWLDGGNPVGQEIFSFTFLALDVMAAFTSMMTRGLFETYPRLRCAVLEAGSNWITAWLDRLDHKFEVMQPFSDSPLKMLPSDYFKRQCLISAEPDESITAAVVEHLGPEYVIWASDYPHLDATFNVVGEIRERISGLPEDWQRKVLGENVLRFYGMTA